MTIPDDVIRRAAEAIAKEREPYMWSHQRDRDRMVRNAIPFVVAALPILRDAIREELVQEMRDATHWWIIVKDDEQGQLMDDWLLSYLPESETTP